VLLYIAHDPGARLCDIAARTGITGRTAYSIVADLTRGRPRAWAAACSERRGAQAARWGLRM
jgi:hypothetical protein